MNGTNIVRIVTAIGVIGMAFGIGGTYERYRGTDNSRVPTHRPLSLNLPISSTLLSQPLLAAATSSDARRELAEDEVPNGRTLATAGEDGTIKLWDTSTLELVRSIEANEIQIPCLAFTPDSKTLISAGFAKTVKLWDVATGELRIVLPAHDGNIESLALSGDGLILATGSGADDKIRLWRAATPDDVQAAGW